MLRIYKKCEKSLDNIHGIEEIKDLDNYDRPFLMCISPQDNIPKSVFGIIKEGARASRVRTSDELAGGFKIDEMPIDFLGITYEYKNIKDQKSEGLLDFIYKYLTKGKNIKKQARKINFFTYCNGTNIYVELEKKLINKLISNGYTEEEVKDIVSQISLVSIGSEIDIKDIHAKSVLFKDANDREVFDQVSKYGQKEMIKNNRESTILRLNKHRDDSPIAFLYNGSGEHELKEYFKDGNIIKSSICAVENYFISNSIQNEQTDNLIPLDINEIKRKILRYNGEFDTENKLLSKLDEEIDYGTGRYTKEEHELLSKLDKTLKKLNSTRMYLENVEQSLKKEQKDKELLIKGIKEKCSDVAFEQIVVSNGMWNNTGKDYSTYATDRQVREEYEKLALNEEKSHTL